MTDITFSANTVITIAGWAVPPCPICHRDLVPGDVIMLIGVCEPAGLAFNAAHLVCVTRYAAGEETLTAETFHDAQRQPFTLPGSSA